MCFIFCIIFIFQDCSRPVVTEVMELINNVFTSEAEAFWISVYPQKNTAAVLAPSSSGSEVATQAEIFVKDIASSLSEQLLIPFKDMTSETFWASMTMHVMAAIAGPLFSYSHSLTTSGEQNVRAYLVEPVIRELIKHLSTSIPGSRVGYPQFSATVNMEQSIRLHRGSGKRSTVDFLIVVRGCGGGREPLN